MQGVRQRLPPPPESGFLISLNERPHHGRLSRLLCVTCAFLFASGLLNGQDAALALEEEIVDPLEGQQFAHDEGITIEINGQANTDYTIYIVTEGSAPNIIKNIATDGDGEGSDSLAGGILDPGDHVLQLREGKNVVSGPTLDTITITVNDPPE